jgi:hypothetical protein
VPTNFSNAKSSTLSLLDRSGRGPMTELVSPLAEPTMPERRRTTSITRSSGPFTSQLLCHAALYAKSTTISILGTSPPKTSIRWHEVSCWCLFAPQSCIASRSLQVAPVFPAASTIPTSDEINSFLSTQRDVYCEVLLVDVRSISKDNSGSERARILLPSRTIDL